MRWIILVLLAVAVFIAMRFGKKAGENTRAAQMMKKYAALDAETLATVPEGEVADAIVSRVLSETEKYRPADPLKVLSEMQHGYTVVYSVWVLCKELAVGDFETLMHGYSAPVVELAESGFSAIGATACAEALTALRGAYAAQQDAETENDEAYAAAEQALHAAIESECPLGLCETYARERPDEFFAADLPEGKDAEE